MRVIDTDIIAQLAAEELRPFFLLEMTIDGTPHRYTDCDIPLALDGDLYSPRGFEAGSITYSKGQIVDRASFLMDDVDQTLKAVFVGGTPRGSAVIYRLVVLDANYNLIGGTDSADQESVILFEGEIDQWAIDEQNLSFSVTSDAHRWAQKPLSTQSGSCRWKVFKGDECTYAGVETWCDRTYSRCSALGNTANFGGFRWLPSLEGQEVWWGRVPK